MTRTIRKAALLKIVSWLILSPEIAIAKVLPQWYNPDMTKFEQTQQPLTTFEKAGRTAFGMMILKTSNPYPRNDKNGVPEPAAQAWDRGYQAAADEAFQKEHPTKRPYVQKTFKPRPDARKTEVRKPSPTPNHPRFVKQGARNGR